jgi:DNA replication and repair protein RecF
MDTMESPLIEYKFFDNTTDNGSIEQCFLKQLELKREDEIRRGSNLVGPHRDDFLFTINSKDLKKYGSQGQNKTFQVSLRFAQFFYLKDILFF